MSKQYDNLVARLGPEGAKAYMSELRQKVKSPGFKNMDKTRLKEIAKLGAKARHEKNSHESAEENPASETQS